MANNQVYPIVDGPVAIIGGHVSTMKVSLGIPVATGRLAWVQNTYPSAYNHAVKCYESFAGSGTLSVVDNCSDDYCICSGRFE